MKNHYSCAELAAMKLSGMPTTKMGWIDLIKRESWPAQKRSGRGGGFEYLPPAKIARLIALPPVIEARGTGGVVTLTITVSLAEATHITRWLERQARK